MDKGKPAYTYNFFGLESYTIKSSSVLPKGTANVTLQFDYDGDGNGKGGNVSIMADGNKIAEGRVEKTQPMVFSADETADVGLDEGTQVTTAFADMDDSKFTGDIKRVTISIPE